MLIVMIGLSWSPKWNLLEIPPSLACRKREYIDCTLIGKALTNQLTLVMSLPMASVLMPFEQLFLWGTHRPIDVSPEDRFDVLLEEAEGWLWLQENQRLQLMQRNASSAPPTRSVTGQTVHSGRRSLELARAAPDLDDTASNEIGSIDSVIIQSADAVGVERVGSDIQRLSREPTDTSAGMEPALTADTVPREENSAITALNPGSVDIADSDTDLDSDLNLSSDPESEAGDLDQTSRTVVLQ